MCTPPVELTEEVVEQVAVCGGVAVAVFAPATVVLARRFAVRGDV
jgi:hypothetical protein